MPRQLKLAQDRDPFADFPEIPDALIDRLDETFPDRAPSINTDPRDMLVHASQVSVVRFLKEVRDRQVQGSPDENVLAESQDV